MEGIIAVENDLEELDAQEAVHRREQKKFQIAEDIEMMEIASKTRESELLDEMSETKEKLLYLLERIRDCLQIWCELLKVENRTDKRIFNRLVAVFNDIANQPNIEQTGEWNVVKIFLDAQTMQQDAIVASVKQYFESMELMTKAFEKEAEQYEQQIGYERKNRDMQLKSKRDELKIIEQENIDGAG